MWKTGQHKLISLQASLKKNISLQAATTNPPSISPDPPPPPEILHRSHLISLRRRCLGTASRFPHLILGYEVSLPRHVDHGWTRNCYGCPPPAPSRSPWKPRSPRSILVVTAGNDYKTKTHKVSEMRWGWGRSFGAAPGGSIYSTRRTLSKVVITLAEPGWRKEFGSDVNSAGAGGYSMGQKSGGSVAAQMHSSGATTHICTRVSRRLRDVQKWCSRSTVMVCSAVVTTLRGDCDVKGQHMVQIPKIFCRCMAQSMIVRSRMVLLDSLII
ncbi:uncharacterized protein [Aegilops tauschii subsp. strangulata]|uniref:uncharacterized protein isoform X2 n=1 Tax=Aegilops tauschii subsp. strangulata TaxID=200361 RepID=UPI001ABBFA08|nr:uncharacterized protein LOC109771790 isoform X2 [Aegilops tauschii subsp. strangulata]